MFVTVIIPTFNYQNKIIAAIESIIAQDYPKELIEIIVVDDGSTDNTKYVIDQLNLDNILYYYQSNNGKASATKKAIELSSGDVIFNLDADDVFLPGKIKKSIEVYKTFDEVSHVSSPALIRDKNNKEFIENIPPQFLNKVIEGNQCLSYFYINNMLFGGGSTFSCRSSILKNAIIEDYVNMYIDELLILIALQNGSTYFFSEPLSVWKIHGNNYSIKKTNSHVSVAKNRSLLNSSQVISNFLINNNYSPEVIKLYQLKHYTRELSSKEYFKTKTILDIAKYLNFIFFQNSFNWTTILRYNCFNRLLPISVLNILRIIKHSS